MAEPTKFLDQAYELGNPDETREFYRQWAQTYDDELRANGYASPKRAAAAMAGIADDLAAPLLDLGCGTGLSGEALRDAGFTTIDGTDFSGEMLKIAEAKNVYRATIEGDLNQPIPTSNGTYQNFAAVGVFSPGHAPPEMISTVAQLLPPRGCFGFSLNDHALEDESYVATINELVEAGTLEVAFKEYGAHIPKLGLQSMIYVLRAN